MKCRFAWYPGRTPANDRPDYPVVTCIRDLGHTGRCIARHPTDLGEHVYFPGVVTEPDDLTLPSDLGEPEPLL